MKIKCPVCESSKISARNGTLRCYQETKNGDVCGFCCSYDDWDRISRKIEKLKRLINHDSTKIENYPLPSKTRAKLVKIKDELEAKDRIIFFLKRHFPQQTIDVWEKENNLQEMADSHWMWDDDKEENSYG